MDTDPKFNSILVPLVAVSALFILFSFYGAAFATITVRNLASITTAGGAPTRIAADGQGILYAAVPASGKVFKFFRDGSPAGVITASQKPLSVAADSTGKVYVGDYVDGSVRALGPDGRVLYSLGQGKGEFRMPGDIAVSSSGLVYVTDSMNNMVKIYNQDGTFRSSFGGYGTGPGKMIFPTGICPDNANDDIYVIDQTNGRVEVFDPDGIFRRSFGSYGSGQGMLTRGQGIHVANGKVYVADAYQSRVEVFDTAGNFVSFIGSYGSGQGDLKIPMDVMMVGTTLYVANSDNSRMELFDISDPQGLDVSPANLSFTADAGTNPLLQTVLINPATAGSVVSWTATFSAPFGLNLSASSGTTPAQVEVGVDVAGLPEGTYNGAVVFHAAGTDYPVSVSLIVAGPPAELMASPTVISLSYGNGIPGAQSISVSATGGPLSWSASADVSWLALSPASGTTPGSVLTSLKQSVESLPPGVYNGTVTIEAPGAAGSPAVVSVALSVACPAINVEPSILPSGMVGVPYTQIFTQTGGTGPVTFSASGALPGGVTFSNGMLSGTPTQSGSFPVTVTASAVNGCIGSTAVTFTVERQSLLVTPVGIDLLHETNGDLATGNLSVSSIGGPLDWSASTDAQWLSIQPSDGCTPAVVAVALNRNVDALAGGSYTAQVTVTAPDAANSPVQVPVTVTVKAWKAETIIVTSNLDSTTFTISGRTASGDTVTFLGHGTDWRTDDAKPGTYTIHFDHNQGYRRPADRTFDVVAGETMTIDVLYRPSAVANVIAAGKGPNSGNDAKVRIFDLDGKLIKEFAALNTKYGARVAMADINGDGDDEIIVAPGNGLLNLARVRVFRCDGSLVTETPLLAKTLYGAVVAAGDIDGDGRAEVAMSIVESTGSQSIIVYAFDGRSLVQKTKISFKETVLNPVAIALGDIDGDGWLELIRGSSGKITVYSFYADLSAARVISSVAIPTLQPSYRSPVTVAAGDINGDGSSDVLIGYVNGKDSMVQVFNSELAQAGLPFKVFENGISSPSISSMDLDGDGHAEILTGKGAYLTNNAVVRVYDFTGRQMQEIRAFDSTYGVNAAFGSARREGTDAQ